VIGGGWAGCAAAVTLAQVGVPVTLFEQSATLGGRARRVLLDGKIVVDNGQHLLVGAYRQTLDLIGVVHGRDGVADLFSRLPLTLQPFGMHRPGVVALAAWPVRAPFHLAGALVTARGLSWRHRLALFKTVRDLARAGFRCSREQTVAECFSSTPPSIITALWEPLCLAALNTPPARASAEVFLHVLREALAGPGAPSDFLVPARDLSACFPDAVARFAAERGSCVRTGVAVRAVDGHPDRVTVRAGGSDEDYAGTIVAVAPHQLRRTIGPAAAAADGWREPLQRVSAFAYESITTVYLRFATPLRMRAPLLRLDDAPGQWIFRHAARVSTPAEQDGSPVYAVVISAGGPHDEVGHSELVDAVVGQLQRLAPDLPRILWSRVIAERRATYACTPGLLRPRPGRIVPRVYLAGDYTDPQLPATLEAATRSGVAAAQALIADGHHRLA